MSISENYIPQSENLEHFNNIVGELQQITNENSQLKSRILTQVDSLIKQLNQGRSDNSNVIKRLNKFIAEVNGEEVGSINEVDDEKEQLLIQNQQLKDILANKIEYNEELEALNNEYHDNIDIVMNDIRERRFKNDEISIRNYNDVQRQLSLLQDEEFNTYLQLIKNQQLLAQMHSSLSDLLKKLTIHEYDVEIHKMLTTLELYKSVGFTTKPRFNYNNYKTAQIFIPSIGTSKNDWPSWKSS